ncbi:methyltransferase domain-containing protein [Thermodesulfobacteriota bacterium]
MKNYFAGAKNAPHRFRSTKESPILINDASSLFSRDQFVNGEITTLKPTLRSKQLAHKLLPSVGHNLRGEGAFETLVSLLRKQAENPVVLIVGSGNIGRGIQTLTNQPDIEVVESDVCFSGRVEVLCDAHDIPFETASFDGIVVQKVIPNVADPYRCVEEIHRILNRSGLVYAETAFLLPVHLGPYDFTRFTHLGHRRLFRCFDEVDSGAVAGPGMALAWAFRSFLLSFTCGAAGRALMEVMARLTSFWLKYFDYFFIDRPGAFDAAPGYYFLGRKMETALSDKALIKLYRGRE